MAAELAAWDMAKKHGFHLCVINPTFVLGPVVSSRTDATSVNIFKVCTLACLGKLCASGTYVCLVGFLFA